MFLTVNEFLGHFPSISLTKEQFERKFTVMYSTPQTLWEIFNFTPINSAGRTILKSSTDKRFLQRDALIEYFYEIVVRNRHKYLALFYAAYFEFKSPKTLKWNAPNLLTINADGESIISVQKNDPSRRLIRNLFYMELLDLTKVTNTVKSRVSFWESLVGMYNRLELEDRFFAPSSIDLFLRDKGTQREARSGVKEINYNNLFYLFQAYQPKASIFNPYAIKFIFKDVLGSALGRSPTKLFSPVLSWGSYLAAFMQVSSYQHYVGVDVMRSACDKVQFLADYYHQLGPEYQKKVDIICSPSEDLLKTKFTTEFKSYFDTIIVCPPYFDMEIYHEGEQSISRYPNYKDWLSNYWGATAKLAWECCQQGGIFAVIANDYHSLDGKFFKLTDDLDHVTQEQGFQPVSMFYLQNRTSPLRAAAKDRTERLYLYRKESPAPQPPKKTLNIKKRSA